MKAIKFFGVDREYTIYPVSSPAKVGLLTGGCGGAGHYDSIEDAFRWAKCIEDQDIKRSKYATFQK